MYDMNVKKLLTALLIAASLLSLAAPALAVSSSFDDITNPVDARNADVLRFMGAVGGKGGNHFDPAGELTRAEFCTIIVGVMGKSDQVAGQLNRTIFQDVGPDHWGRGYVNLAATTPVGEGEDAGRLISGVGNGNFEPDRAITYGEAVTILIRALGYTDEQVGTIWPGDYVAKAGEIGLSDGVSAAAGSSITRAQAAQLFVNMLTCKTSAKTPYYDSLGKGTQDTILLSLNAKADDGSDGAVMTTQGRYLPRAGSSMPVSLLGQKGVQVVDEDGLLVAFIPDNTNSVTVTLSGNAEAGFLVGTNGTRYTISANTPVYTPSEEGGGTYADYFQNLTAGVQVTLYTSNGKITGLYCGAGATAAGDAVIVSGPVSSALFHQLTGGATGYQILKDRQQITLSDIQPYDVVTYDPVNNALMVSDLRLTAVYEGAEPDVRAPESISVLGTELQVLECAVDSLSKFRLGDSVALLLTADGKVAGAAEPSLQVRSTAVGMLDGGSVTIPLPAGGSLTLKGASSEELDGQLVTVTSTYRGKLNVARLPGRSAPGDFDLDKMTLGKYTVAAGAAVYERVGANGPMVPVSLASIELSSIPADKISTYTLNSSDMVDILVLDNVTGNAYTYGILHQGEREDPDSSGLTAVNRTVAVEYSTDTTEELITGQAFQDGGFGGVAKGTGGKAASVVALTAVRNVSSTDFFTAEGTLYVNAGGRVYQVSGGVQCYNNYTKSWFTGEDALDQARAFADTLTVYLDPVGEMVRVVVAR